ncbi:MAG: hypothetical protein ABL866_14205 [Devosia sp.]
MRDLANNLHTARALSPVVAGTDNTAYVSQKLDMLGYESAMLAIMIGANTDADATFTVLIEDSPDNTNFTAVDDAYLTGTEVLASFQFDDDNETRKIGYVGTQRYLRATITPANNGAGNIYMAAVWILGNPSRKPTANPPQ